MAARASVRLTGRNRLNSRTASATSHSSITMSAAIDSRNSPTAARMLPAVAAASPGTIRPDRTTPSAQTPQTMITR
jgi:hypothetical protein